MKKSILTIAITMISTLSMLSQSWTPVGTGHSSKVERFYVHTNGKLFFNNVSSTTDTIFTWDGTSTSYISQISNYNIINMCQYGSDVAANCNTSIFMLKYTGTSWTIYSGFGTGNSLDSIFGRLYTASTGGIGYWNGSAVTGVPGFSTSGAVPITLSADKVNTEMFACGNFTYSGTSGVINNTPLVQFQGGGFITGFPNTGLPTPFNLSTLSRSTSALNYNGDIYMTGTFGNSTSNLHGQLYKWNGTSASWTNIWTDCDTSSIANKLVISNNKLYYYSGRSKIGDTTKILEYDGTNMPVQIGMAINTSTNSTINDIINYQNSLYVGGSFSSINGISFKNIAKFTTAPMSVTSVIQNAICNGSSTGSVAFNVSSGIPPYTYLWSPGGYTTTASVSNLAAGTYTVEIDDNAPFPNMIFTTVTITQPSALTASITQSANTATMNVSGGSPSYTYSWSPGSYTTASVSSLSNNTYTCVATDNNGCSITKTIIVNTTGVKDLTKSNTTVIYPNPSNGVVYIVTEQNSIVNVINSLGQIILHFITDNKATKINIENAGIYTVQISKNNQVSNSRLIIQ